MAIFYSHVSLPEGKMMEHGLSHNKWDEMAIEIWEYHRVKNITTSLADVTRHNGEYCQRAESGVWK